MTAEPQGKEKELGIAIVKRKGLHSPKCVTHQGKTGFNVKYTLDGHASEHQNLPSLM